MTALNHKGRVHGILVQVGKGAEMRRLIGLCIFVALVHSMAGCSEMKGYAKCGDIPCKPGSPMYYTNPSACRTANEPAVKCWEEHWAQERAQKAQWVSATSVGVDQFVGAWYTTTDESGKEAGWFEVHSFTNWDDFCKERGYKKASYFRSFETPTSQREKATSPLCERPKVVPGTPNTLWCVKCGN